jgi:hypothetical protein
MHEATLLWHVTLTVAGDDQETSAVHEALVRLQSERPFMHSLRYSEGRAEIRYWEEGEDMLDAASLALRMWSEHRVSAALPNWKVVGLEVVERETFQSRNIDTRFAPADVKPRRF